MEADQHGSRTGISFSATTHSALAGHQDPSSERTSTGLESAYMDEEPGHPEQKDEAEHGFVATIGQTSSTRPGLRDSASLLRGPPLYFMERAMVGLRSLGRSEIEEILKFFWFPAATFAVAEIGAFCAVRKSFFEALTNGTFELEPRFETVVEVHVWCSVLMWCMAAVQVLWERSRRSPHLAGVHRRLGQAFLLLFYLIVFPTSLYLTMRQRIDWLAPAVGAVLLDTAFCTSYFLYRGWRVARLKRNVKSMALHGRLMQCGVVMSMSILPQRLLQLYLITQLRQYPQLNYTISILMTSVLFVLFGHFWDGPRGGIWMACIGAENAEEAFGRATASPLERSAWRLRWLVYMLLYFVVRRHCCAGEAEAASATGGHESRAQIGHSDPSGG